jgi:hypothetical protein
MVRQRRSGRSGQRQEEGDDGLAEEAILTATQMVRQKEIPRRS